MEFFMLMSVLTFFNLTGGTMLADADFMQPKSVESMVIIEDVSE